MGGMKTYCDCCQQRLPDSWTLPTDSEHLKEIRRLRAELAACREALVDTKSALFAAEMRLAARKGEEGERDEHYDS